MDGERHRQTSRIPYHCKELGLRLLYTRSIELRDNVRTFSDPLLVIVRFVLFSNEDAILITTRKQRRPMELIEEPSEGDNTIVARLIEEDVVVIVTSMSSLSYDAKAQDFRALGDLVNRYENTSLLLMGDLNAISPQDANRYNESLLCGNGTYDANAHTGEYVINFCLQNKTDGHWYLDYSPIKTLLDTTSLVDLCFVNGGFYDVDEDVLSAYSNCALSNPTTLIRMAGNKTYAPIAYTHAMAKIDYIFANDKLMKHPTRRFHHTTVMRSAQLDGCSDHYPIEATFS